LNRKSCEIFGIEPEKMVGQKIYFEWQGELYTYEVIGVMENYHQNSLKEEINPTLFDMASDPTQFANIMISVNTDNFKETLASLETTWNKIVADTPFEFAFLDDNLEKLYQEDQKVSQIITSFTLIALMICCLGLYGLSTYMAERRTKEIGVRKVLGASVKQIVGMMNMEFVKLVAVAFALAVPLAWYGMDKWLSGFAYKVSIGLSVFVYAGLSALVIAILTVSYESIKAASVNPANSLRSE
ncbi:MAG: ABC transporter permease, partial [Bacteroidota bacterium]